MSDLREAAAQGWAAIHNTSEGRQFVGTLGERNYSDEAPGRVVGNDARGGVQARSRLALDANLDLVEDKTRSQRISPRDVGVSQAGLMGLHLLARNLGEVKGLDGLDRSDAEVARRIVGRVGIDNLDRLWLVGSHSDAFLRHVSKAAARSGVGTDAFNQIFINSELTLTLPELVEIEKRQPSARDVFPMKFLNAPGAVDYEFRTIDRKGRAEHTATFEGDAPTAAITSSPGRRPLHWMWSGITFSWQDIEQWKQARANGSPLPDVVAEMQKTARAAILDLENIDLFFGNPTLKITGLLSGNQNINTPAAVAAIQDAATSEAAVQLLLSGVQRVFAQRFKSKMRVLLGTRDFAYCSTATYVDASNGSTGRSLLQVALERGKALGLEAFVHVPEVAFEEEVETYLADLGYSASLAEKFAGGIGGKATMVTVVNDPLVHRGIVGQDLMQFPPDQTSTVTRIQYAASTGGLEVRQPKGLDIQILNDPT